MLFIIWGTTTRGSFSTPNARTNYRVSAAKSAEKTAKSVSANKFQSMPQFDFKLMSKYSQAEKDDVEVEH